MSGRVPPSSRFTTRRYNGGEVERAKQRYTRFSGHEAELLGKVNVPAIPKVAAVIGELDFVGYTTVRDGKREAYIHKFAASDKPLLAVSPDGKQILLIGGNYTFTARGIVDKSDRKR